MARYNDNSPYCERWTNRKLMAEARKYANMESMSIGHYDGDEITFKPGWTGQVNAVDPADFARNVSRLYRETWLAPILDEIERRFVKGK